MTCEATIFVYGAGGHASVVADALGDAVAGFLDDDPARAGSRYLGRPVLAPDALPQGARVHVAVGDNETRARLGAVLRAQGTPLATVRHPGASVSARARLGVGVFVAAGAVVAPGACLGDGVIVNHGAVVDHDCHVGEWCHIGPNAALGGAARIGALTLIGANAAVLPQRRIVSGCRIGAGAAVTRDIDAPGSFGGAPARLLSA